MRHTFIALEITLAEVNAGMWTQPRIAFAVFLARFPNISRFAEAQGFLTVAKRCGSVDLYEDLRSSPPLVQRLEDGSSIWPQMCP
jgi:hypothetical protein